MDINATIDVGDNVTGMAERLASQLGTTADKVFPWYVQQAYLQGLTEAIAIGVALILFGVMFAISVRKADFNNGNIATPISIASGIALCISLVLTFVAGPQTVRKMVNPQFYAMSMITEDVAKLVRRR